MRRPLPLTLILVAALALPAPAARACGPIWDTAYFSFRTHPDAPFEPYASGQLGVLQPTYARSYLAVAYRHLEGVPTSAEDQASVVALWERRLKVAPNDGAGDDPERAWLEARAPVAERAPDLPALDGINEYHPLEGGYYWSYLNCTPDGFRTATATLDDLVARHGEKNKHVQEWVRGQDQVFANCDGQTHAIPVVDAARAGYWSRAPAVFRQHRAYQIAAAHFYAGEYDDAHRRFLAIAEDRGSPWATIAPYLAARALVRKGMFAAGDGAADLQTLARAEQQIQAVLADTSRAEVHPSARALDHYVQLYLDPQAQVHTLAASITAPTNGVPLGDAVDDYTRLLDRFLEWQRYEGLDPRADGLTDWVTTYQNPGDEAREHALARWRETRSTAWLIAALSKVPADHPALDELLAHAGKVPADDPGLLTIRHHGAELLLASGRQDEARHLLDQVLIQEDLPRGARNQFLDRRLTVATGFEDLVSLVPRTPVCTGEDELWAVHGCGEAKQAPLISRSGAQAVEALPLSLVAELAAREELPVGVRRNVARAGFTRAVLSGEHAHGAALGQTLLALDPTLAEWLQPYLDAAEPAERDEAALVAMLWLPGLRPQVEAGLPRTAWVEMDSYRDNWWCAPVAEPDGVPALAFLDEVQVAERARERAVFADMPTAPDMLCELVVAWAEADPDDPRVPAALHRAVKATRYGCTSSETGRWSKEAFQTLHRLYPESSWTAETPYWYK